MKRLLAFLIPIFYLGFAACEERDNAYAQQEAVLINSNNYNDYIFGVVIDTSSRILAAGVSATTALPTTGFAIARILTTGVLDTSFHTDGKVLVELGTNAAITHIEVLGNGKILATGNVNSGIQPSFAAARFNTDGTIDTSFATVGYTYANVDNQSHFSPNSIARSDGTFVMVGYTRSHMGRFLSDGSLDTSFHTDGWVNLNNNLLDGNFDVINDSQSAYIVSLMHCYDQDPGIGVDCWWGSSLYRVLSDGTIDPAYGPSVGSSHSCNMTYDYNYRTLTRVTNNRVLAGGYEGTTGDAFIMCRFNSNGTVDSSFGNNGRVHTSIGTGAGYGYIRKLLVQTDGKYVAVGYVLDTSAGGSMSLVRYYTNGQVDTTFGTNGFILTRFGTTGGNYLLNGSYGLTGGILTDGKILVAGEAFNGQNADFAIAMYWP